VRAHSAPRKAKAANADCQRFAALQRARGHHTELSPEVEELLVVDALAERNAPAGSRGRQGRARDKTQVVTYRVPHNAAIQIYDYKAKRSRCVS